MKHLPIILFVISSLFIAACSDSQQQPEGSQKVSLTLSAQAVKNGLGITPCARLSELKEKSLLSDQLYIYRADGSHGEEMARNIAQSLLGDGFAESREHGDLTLRKGEKTLLYTSSLGEPNISYRDAGVENDSNANLSRDDILEKVRTLVVSDLKLGTNDDFYVIRFLTSVGAARSDVRESSSSAEQWVKVQRQIHDLSVMGRKGALSISFSPAGKLATFSFSPTQFQATDRYIRSSEILSVEEAHKRAKEALVARQRDPENYTFSCQFAYTGSETILPSFIFSAKPKSGVVDKLQVVHFAAVDDPSLQALITE